MRHRVAVPASAAVALRLLASCALLGLGACEGLPSVAPSTEPIVGGAPDDRHPGVVALLEADGRVACSGSIVATGGGRTAVLTAAHCLERALTAIAQGVDLSAPDRIWPIAERRAHPDFDRATGRMDVAVVVAAGEAEPASVLGVLTPQADRLAVGQEIAFVGFGSTRGPVANRTRRAARGTIEALDPVAFSYLQAAAGPCDGDSGGPALVSVDGRPLVAGVTSFGDAGCQGLGVSARASAAAPFLMAALTAAPTAPLAACAPPPREPR